MRGNATLGDEERWLNVHAFDYVHDSVGHHLLWVRGVEDGRVKGERMAGLEVDRGERGRGLNVHAFDYVYDSVRNHLL